MAALYYSPFIPAFSSNGLPVPGAKIFFFYSGTNNLAPIYTDKTLTTVSPNPVVSDLAARFPATYLKDDIIYRVRLVDADGIQLGDDIDPYFPGQAVTDIPSLPELLSPTGANRVGYQADSSSVTQTVQDTVRRQPLNLYDKIPKNLWTAIENGTNTVDLSNYVQSAMDSGRAIVARKGRYRCNTSVNGNAVTIRGEGKQLTYFENVNNNSIFTLDSSNKHIVGFELEDLWVENRDPSAYTSCDLLKILGSGDGSQWQNDSHSFKNVWFFQGRDNFACYSRSIWNVFEECNFTGAQRDGIHVETIGNVNQWEFSGRNIVKGNGRNGLFFKHDGVDLATGWIIDNMSTEDSGFEGWRITGSGGIQAWSVRGSTFENNARLIAPGSSASVDGIRRRKAGIFVDSMYLAGFDINTCTLYNNQAGGTGGDPDQHIYVSSVGPTNQPVLAQSGAIANSRFTPVQPGGNDVIWPIGLTYHANNFNNPTTPVLLDEKRGSLDLRYTTTQVVIPDIVMQLTGLSGPATGLARFVKQGDLAAMLIPNITGTSNSSTATLIGLPQALWPVRDQTVSAIVQDATGGVQMGLATIKTTGVIELYKDVGGSPFSTTGLKGVKYQNIQWQLS